MFAHQFFDSTNPVWLNGPHGEVYYTQILPPGEFEGTALDAPKRRARPGDEEDLKKWHLAQDLDSDEYSEDDDEYYSQSFDDKHNEVQGRRMFYSQL